MAIATNVIVGNSVEPNLSKDCGGKVGVKVS